MKTTVKCGVKNNNWNGNENVITLLNAEIKTILHKKANNMNKKKKGKDRAV